MLTTIQQKKRTEVFESSDIDEAYELVKSELRSSTLHYISVRKKAFTGNPKITWEIIVEHENAGH